MIRIEIANKENAELLSLLGRVTYVESHGHFIEDKNDEYQYVNKAFSVAKTKQDLNNPNHLFYIVYVDDLPVGYAKLVLNATNDSISSPKSCQLERIYILSDFIPLKIGQQLLTFVHEKAKEHRMETMWLTVYIKNDRAIRFYKRNEFQKVGNVDFLVNGTNYPNWIFAREI